MAITSVARLNAYLGESDTTDAKIHACDAANSLVSDICGRVFDSTDYSEWVYLAADTLVLRHRPIQVIERLASGTVNGISLYWPTSTAPFAQVSVTDGQIHLTPYTGGAVGVATSLTLDDYTSATLVSAIAAVGWTAEELLSCDPRSIKPMTSSDCVTPSTVYLEVPDDQVEAVHVDYETGIVRLASAEAGWVFAQYTAGYDAPPSGLIQIATEYAAAMLRSASINPNVQSEKLGDYQYTNATGGTNISTVQQTFIDRLYVYRQVSL